uniref:Uncharacterized protein n=1 Tax=Salix viminalis TaxID=40686 RepID=A0A6N2MJV5_SALVM
MAQYKKHRLTIEGNLEPSTSSPIHLCSSRSLLETWHNTRNIVLPQKVTLSHPHLHQFISVHLVVFWKHGTIQETSSYHRRLH